VNSLRLWIVILATVSAAAGFAGGLLLHAALTPQPKGPFADYERLMDERFELSPERARLFHTVLASYNQEREAVKDRFLAESMSAMEPELRHVGLKYRDLIRNSVLPPDRREEFDRLARGVSEPGPR
jgi:hypothetical protein